MIKRSTKAISTKIRTYLIYDLYANKILISKKESYGTKN